MSLWGKEWRQEVEGEECSVSTAVWAENLYLVKQLHLSSMEKEGKRDSQGCVGANSCSHSPLLQPAVENSYSWSSPTTECLGCTVRTGYLWREVTGEHFTVILVRSCKYTEIYFLYSKSELEVVKKLYMISICIFFYFCHSETFLAAVIIHEVPKAAY